MKNYYYLFITSFLFLSTAPAFSANDHSHDHDHEHEESEQHPPHKEKDKHGEHGNHEDDGHGHGGHEHGDENSSRIEDKMASQVGIVTSVSGAQELHQTITVFGTIVSAPEELSHVRARFEGLVKSVKVTLGDRVKAGDVLAEVESNESLKTYTIRSPIAGRVVQRHANVGEVTKDQVLFSIANFDTVWAQLRVYPAHQSSVTEGQTVNLLTTSGSLVSTIDHILPSMDSPYQIARIKLVNDNETLSPGLMTEARIEVSRFSVAVAVAKNAVQTLAGRQGVFVKYDEEYQFKPLVLGRSDDLYFEVIEGLEAGSEYVSQNSYLIKADIEKSEAEHVH